MKKPGAEIAFFTPDIQGWRARWPKAEDRVGAALELVLEGLSAGHEIHLALPVNMVLIERLTLPAVERTELEGMVELQLEKTLPYSLEEAVNHFEIIRQTETESVVLSVSANCAQVDELCAPFRSAGRLPQKITLYATLVAASCVPEECVLCIWPEDGQLAVAIIENGKLGFAHSIFGTDAESLRSELPQVLLSAEMEGVPTTFSRVRIEKECEELRLPLSELFEGTIVCEALLREGDCAGGGDLAPPAWQAEVHRIAKAGRLRQQLQAVAVIYLLALAGAFLYLAWLKGRVQKLDAQLAESRPQVEFIATRQMRWRQLAPAINPSYYAIEIMNLVVANLPSPEVKLTTFELSLGAVRIDGEAPSSSQAVEFLEKLTQDKVFKDLGYNFESPPPKVLQNDSAQFSIFGKL